MSEADALIDDLPDPAAPEVLAPVSPPPDPAGADAAASRVRLEAALEAVVTDPAYRTPGPRTAALIDQALALRRALLAGENKTQVAYRDAGEALPATAPPPDRLTIGREDLERLAPGSWSRGETTRVVAAADALGVGPYEMTRLFNYVADPAPPPEAEIADLTELWGEETDGNIKLVNALLTKLRAHDADLHDRVVVYIQRDPKVAEHALQVARRLAGHAPRSAPTPRAQTPAAGKPVDRPESRWPFVWSDEVRR